MAEKLHPHRGIDQRLMAEDHLRRHRSAVDDPPLFRVHFRVGLGMQGAGKIDPEATEGPVIKPGPAPRRPIQGAEQPAPLHALQATADKGEAYRIHQTRQHIADQKEKHKTGNHPGQGTDNGRFGLILKGNGQKGRQRQGAENRSGILGHHGAGPNSGTEHQHDPYGG